MLKGQITFQGHSLSRKKLAIAGISLALIIYQLKVIFSINQNHNETTHYEEIEISDIENGPNQTIQTEMSVDNDQLSYENQQIQENKIDSTEQKTHFFTKLVNPYNIIFMIMFFFMGGTACLVNSGILNLIYI